MVPALTNPFLREVASARETRSLAPREQQQHACSLNGHSSLRFHRHNKRAQNRTDPPSLLLLPLPLLTNGLTDGMDFLGLGSGLGWASGHARRRRLLLAQQPPLRYSELECCGMKIAAFPAPRREFLWKRRRAQISLCSFRHRARRRFNHVSTAQRATKRARRTS